MSEEQEVFVSRRGRKTKLDTVDLNGIAIDEQPPVAAPVVDDTPPLSLPPKLASTPKIRRKLPTLPKTTLSKKIWVVIFGVILLLMLVPVLVLELVALQYRTSAESLKTEVTRIGTDIAIPEQKKQQLSDDGIKKSLDALTAARDGSCKGGLLDNVATIYPRSKEALAECATANGTVSNLINSLSVLQKMHTYGVAAEVAIRPALAASDSPYAVIRDQLNTWQSASGKLKAIDPPSHLNAFHTSLKQVTSDIATQWSALNTAHNSQDEAAFKTTETKLGSLYESLRELSATFVEAQNNAQTDVSEAVSRI